MTRYIATDPGNLDPQAAINSTSFEVAGFAYDPLINESNTGQFESGIASRWKHSGRTYQFTIKPGVKCSDGSTMTAQQVVANLNYINDPKNKSTLAGIYYPPGSVAKASGNVVTVTIPSPSAFFLQAVTSMPMVCGSMSNRSRLRSKTDGTGPYVLTQAAQNDHYTFTRRNGYTWGPNGASTATAGMPKTVTFKIVANETTTANLLLSVNGPVAGNVVGADRSRLDAAKMFHQDVLIPEGDMAYNQAAGHATDDVRVRRALTMALNLGDIGKVFSGGDGVAPTQLITQAPVPCKANTVQGNVPAFDVNGAKALLDQAGWLVGPGGVRTKNGKKLSLTLLYSTEGGSGVPSAAELAQQELKAVGVDVNLVGKADSQVTGILFGSGSSSWDITWEGIGVNNQDQLVPVFDGAVPPNGENYADVHNQQYEKLVNAARRAGSAGCPIWDKSEVALLHDADFIPFVYTPTPTWGNHVRFALLGLSIIPTSIRITQ